MRTLLLSATAAFLFTATAASAQTKGAPVPVAPTTTSAATDPLMEQKRSLSTDLKGTLGTTEAVMGKARAMMAEAKGDDVEKCGKAMEGLRTVHADLTEQLNLVNQATEANSAAVFARAAEVSAASAKSVDAYTAQLKSVAQ